ncbi:MAG: hypothetical protein L0Z55_05750 [Planctomycetes bacterium]|nr:hypothetical protein [Planctomycetota bacterium]
MHAFGRVLCLSLFVAGLAMFAMAGCAHKSGSTSDTPGSSKSASASSSGKATGTDPAGACQACAKGLAGEPAWCDAHNRGFDESGKELKCKGCYVASTGGPACKTCKK